MAWVRTWCVGLLALAAVASLPAFPTHGLVNRSHAAWGVAEASGRGGSVSVRGYIRKDGTYVQPHMRSAPDGNFWNNWSTRGNVNPYNGEPGTKTQPSPGSGGDVYVDGYYRSDGSYVPPHYRSVPDGDPSNNWSTRGDVAPNAGTDQEASRCGFEFTA